MASLKIWDKKMSGLGPESQDIRLSQEAAKLCAIPIPRALNSAIAIMQNWVSLQQSDPNKVCSRSCSKGSHLIVSA